MMSPLGSLWGPDSPKTRGGEETMLAETGSCQEYTGHSPYLQKVLFAMRRTW